MAVYIFNFVSFVKWPQSSDGKEHATFDICTLGQDEVTGLLKGVIDGGRLEDKPLRYKPLSSVENLSECQILYLTSVDDPTMELIKYQIDGRPILTISDEAGFANRGGHIEFGLQRQRVHPIINRSAIDSSALAVSAQLYRLATIVE